ncbi:hypothetical protein M404DRAFT_1000810 [Pisolithus tinctorius Marx 270]|uniref:Uncharacterized protein n=1 Tax=Pisolithus tinctorius Marx 270 TaxID=870435 RepID=A0A0C3NSU6_PISTI|nr:hypothetical protein M404DRAFT_1000810 [Pisolithus tinctorius Marx 270]
MDSTWFTLSTGTPGHQTQTENMKEMEGTPVSLLRTKENEVRTENVNVMYTNVRPVSFREATRLNVHSPDSEESCTQS